MPKRVQSELERESLAKVSLLIDKLASEAKYDILNGAFKRAREKGSSVEEELILVNN